MPDIRCPKCDTVFDDKGEKNKYETLDPKGAPTHPELYGRAGHSECPNPLCNPDRAALLAAEQASASAEWDEFQAFKRAKAAKKTATV